MHQEFCTVLNRYPCFKKYRDLSNRKACTSMLHIYKTDQYHSQLLHQQCPSSHTCPVYKSSIIRAILLYYSKSVQIHHTYLLFIPIYYYSSHCNCWLAKKKNLFAIIIISLLVSLADNKVWPLFCIIFVLLIKIIFLTIISFYLHLTTFSSLSISTLAMLML